MMNSVDVDSVNYCKYKDEYLKIAQLRKQNTIRIHPAGNSLSIDLSIGSAVDLMQALYFVLVDCEAIKPGQKEVKQNTTEFHSVNGHSPDPFIFALDALLTDTALGKETRARIKAAINFHRETKGL